MRDLINLVESFISESYSENNTALRNYMKKAEFDPYAHWDYVCQWIDSNDWVEELGFADVEDLEEAGPELFYKLPSEVQEECAESVVEELMHYDPADAPSWSHMSLSKNKLIPRSTWLVHFSDEAYFIRSRGFTSGMDQMDKLGLTTFFNKEQKQYGGYNFAFEADSQDAEWAAAKRKYGKNAVLFQNSGVHAYHYADQENQIIFWGADVAPKDIILLTQEEGDWIVNSRLPLRNGSISLFSGTFTNCVKWVIKNYAQYRRWF